jgi:3-dehydroquinate dehydratase/shikimate dehydrogenase
MGEEGVASRILAAKFGGFVTFASVGAGRESAPGQLDIETMLNMYHFRNIDADTEVYGVAANPVAHSMSPAIHNAAFAATGKNAVYIPLKTNDCAALLHGLVPLGLRGLSVTIPHKQEMCSLMDGVDDLCAAIGAVNTVLAKGGQLMGRNTDVDAAMAAIVSAARRAEIDSIAGRKVLLVGAGGAGRAIAYGLRAHESEVVIANRTLSRAQKLAAELDCEACSLDDMSTIDCDILVNATSIGMWPNTDSSPVPAEMLRPGMVVFDSVYNPVETRLLSDAAEAGCATATGLEWFVSQAAAQFEWWTGTPAPLEVMERVVRQRLTGD